MENVYSWKLIPGIEREDKKGNKVVVTSPYYIILVNGVPDEKLGTFPNLTAAIKKCNALNKQLKNKIQEKLKIETEKEKQDYICPRPAYKMR